MARTGALRVHAFDQHETLLGQGTLGREIEAQAPDLDTLLVAVGGGGLIGGIAAWYGGRIRVIGVEPEAAPTLHRALQAGEPVDAPAGGDRRRLAGAPARGRADVPHRPARVARVVLVSDDAIRQAQQALWSAVRVVAEPGGVATLAALLSGAYAPAEGERVGAVISGGNTTAVDFERPTASG